jgi:hypothetical protein
MAELGQTRLVLVGADGGREDLMTRGPALPGLLNRAMGSGGVAVLEVPGLKGWIEASENYAAWHTRDAASAALLREAFRTTGADDNPAGDGAHGDAYAEPAPG